MSKNFYLHPHHHGTIYDSGEKKKKKIVHQRHEHKNK